MGPRVQSLLRLSSCPLVSIAAAGGSARRDSAQADTRVRDPSRRTGLRRHLDTARLRCSAFQVLRRTQPPPIKDTQQSARTGACRSRRLSVLRPAGTASAQGLADLSAAISAAQLIGPRITKNAVMPRVVRPAARRWSSSSGLFGEANGAACRTRTSDPRITNAARGLFQLCDTWNISLTFAFAGNTLALTLAAASG